MSIQTHQEIKSPHYPAFQLEGRRISSLTISSTKVAPPIVDQGVSWASSVKINNKEEAMKISGPLIDSQ